MAGTERKVMTKELFLASFQEYHKTLLKPLSRRRMDDCFSDDVLETARKVAAELKPKGIGEFRAEVEVKHVEECKVLEMINSKTDLAGEHDPRGPAWRFSGVPEEDARAVQWMVWQDLRRNKMEQLKRIQAHNEEQQKLLHRKMTLLAQLEATREVAFQSFTDTSVPTVLDHPHES